MEQMPLTRASPNAGLSIAYKVMDDTVSFHLAHADPATARSKALILFETLPYNDTGEAYNAAIAKITRGEEREDSDVDLLVKLDRSLPIGLFAYSRMHRELEEKLGHKVDLVEEGTLRPAVQITANRDLKVIYECSPSI